MRNKSKFKKEYKFNRHTMIRTNRQVLRNSRIKIRREGIVILLYNTGNCMKFKALLSIKLDLDITTEIVRVRLHIEANNKLFSINILNKVKGRA